MRTRSSLPASLPPRPSSTAEIALSLFLSPLPLLHDRHCLTPVLAILTFLTRPRRVPLLPRPLLPHPSLPTYFYRLLPAARINSPHRDHRHSRRPSRRHLLGPSCQRHREHTGRRGWHAKLDRRTSASNSCVSLVSLSPALTTAAPAIQFLQSCLLHRHGLHRPRRWLLLHIRLRALKPAGRPS